MFLKFHFTVRNTWYGNLESIFMSSLQFHRALTYMDYATNYYMYLGIDRRPLAQLCSAAPPFCLNPHWELRTALKFLQICSLPASYICHSEKHLLGIIRYLHGNYGNQDQQTRDLWQGFRQWENTTEDATKTYIFKKIQNDKVTAVFWKSLIFGIF